MTAQDPKQHVLGWRGEIEAELEAAKAEVPPLVTAHEAAIAAASEAAEFYREVQKVLRQLTNPESAIRIRVNDHRDELDQTKSRAARAGADLEAARIKIKALQRALAQIDFIIPPAEESEGAT
jgi:chromosome segregation ATPase